MTSRVQFRYLTAVLLMLVLAMTQCRLRQSEEAPLTNNASPTARATPSVGVDFVTLAPLGATVIVTTPTPRPSATPAPSPTPPYYEIASGDTLLGVAIARGTTVDVLQVLNPRLTPELLPVGELILLPTPAIASAVAAQGSLRVPELEILPVNFYRTPTDGLWLFGEIANPNEFSVDDVQLVIDLRDALGDSLMSIVLWTPVAVIQPGDRAPFGVLVSEPPGNFDFPTVGIVTASVAADLGSRYLDLQISNVMLTGLEERRRLSGRLENRGEKVAEEVRLVATFYDGHGRVSGYQQLVLPDVLPPGGQAAFQLEVVSPGGPVADARLVAQSIWQE